MTRVMVAAVGRLRPAFREAVDMYLKRLTRYATIEEVEVKEAGRGTSAQVQRREEAKRLLRRLPARSVTIALSRAGEAWSSADLARRLEEWRSRGAPIAFLIGGSHGLAKRLINEAAVRWCLGPLTLPHELARVVVVEQVYRAFTILAGTPYHKERSGD